MHFKKQLPGSDIRARHVVICPYLVRPYPKRTDGADEDTFNKRLSLVKLTVECTFGIMSNK